MISLGAGIYEELLFRVMLVGALAWTARRVFGWSPGAAGVFATVARRAGLLRLPLRRSLRRPAGARLVHLSRDRGRAVQRPVPAARLRDHRVDPRAVRRVPVAGGGLGWTAGRPGRLPRLHPEDRVQHLPEDRQRLRAGEQAALDVEASACCWRPSAARPRPPAERVSRVAGDCTQASSAGREIFAESARVRKKAAGSLSGAQSSWCW